MHPGVAMSFWVRRDGGGAAEGVGVLWMSSDRPGDHASPDGPTVSPEKVDRSS
jgi:hypothetical protein